MCRGRGKRVILKIYLKTLLTYWGERHLKCKKYLFDGNGNNIFTCTNTYISLRQGNILEMRKYIPSRNCCFFMKTIVSSIQIYEKLDIS